MSACNPSGAAGCTCSAATNLRLPFPLRVDSILVDSIENTLSTTGLMTSHALAVGRSKLCRRIWIAALQGALFRAGACYPPLGVPNYIDQVFTTSKKVQKKKPVVGVKTSGPPSVVADEIARWLEADYVV